MSNKAAKNWYNESYKKGGIKAQRRYPNEELCRFMGRNFFDTDMPFAERKNIKVLELGCGSCSNLWMIAKEGFDAYGCDLSEDAIEVGRAVMEENVSGGGQIIVSDMLATPYENAFFDVVLDVFSSYCLSKGDYLTLLQEINRMSKPSGLFFSYFPSKGSDTYARSKPGDRIDEDTLNGIGDEKSPFYGNDYPFRFMSPEDVRALLPEAGFTLKRMETCGRTYDNGREYFEFIVFEAIKNEAR